MTESTGPDNQDKAAVPGKKKGKRRFRRLRPYAFGAVTMAVVFGISALVGAHVRANKTEKIKAPSGAVGPAVVPTGPSATASASPSATATGPNFNVPVKPAVPVTITVYEDLRSPASKAFSDEYEATLDQLLTTGQAQVHYRLVTPSDTTYGGTGSLDAASAAACAQDQGRFTQFVNELYKKQPDPQSGKLSQESFLKEIAKKTGKIAMGTFEPCYEQEDHLGWVKKSQADYVASGLGGVPVVQINDTTLKDVLTTLTPNKLHSLVLAEAKRVVALQSPTPTPSGSATPSAAAGSSPSDSSSPSATATN